MGKFLYCLKISALATLFFLISTLFAKNTFAATYYIDATGGLDSNTGTSEGSAWQTVNKVNTSTFQAGDSILFKKGETWRERLTIPSSGTSGSQITFGAYGSGNSPKITSSDDVTGTAGSWTSEGVNIWSRSLTTEAKIVIFDDGQLGTNDTTPDAQYDWYWSTNKLYVYATSNPTSYYTKIEAGQRTAVITLNQKDYVTIENLDLYGGQLTGGNTEIQGGIYIPEESVGITISNNSIHDNHGSGILVLGGNSITIQGNTISDISSNSLATYGDGIIVRAYASTSPSTSITVSGNTISGFIDRQGIVFVGASNSTISSNTITAGENNAIDLEGNASDTISNITVSQNTIDKSVGGSITADGSSGTMSNITISSNTIDLNDALPAEIGISLNTSGGTNTIEGNNLEGVTTGIEAGPGISTVVTIRKNKIKHGSVNPGFGVYVRNGVTAYVNYNLIIGSTRAMQTFDSDETTEAKGYFYNNTAYNYTTYGIRNVATAVAKNNIFYTTGTVIIHVYNDAVSTGTYNNNIYYSPNDATSIFHWNGTYYSTLATWRSASSQDSNSFLTNPLLTNVASDNFTVINGGSPGIDNGTDVGLTSDYIDTSVPQGNAPDIGAYELVPPPLTQATTPFCDSRMPESPWLYQALPIGKTSILLSFISGTSSVTSFGLEFGEKSNDYIYGETNIGGPGTSQYMVNNLKPNTTYYFRVKANNSCASSSWSNELSAKTNTSGLIQVSQEGDFIPVTPVIEEESDTKTETIEEKKESETPIESGKNKNILIGGAIILGILALGFISFWAASRSSK